MLELIDRWKQSELSQSLFAKGTDSFP
jgi:hypothetical protein